MNDQIVDQTNELEEAEGIVDAVSYEHGHNSDRAEDKAAMLTQIALLAPLPKPDYYLVDGTDVQVQTQVQALAPVAVGYDTVEERAVVYVNNQMMANVPDNISDSRLHGYIPPFHLLCSIVRSPGRIDLLTDESGPRGDAIDYDKELEGINGAAQDVNL